MTFLTQTRSQLAQLMKEDGKLLEELKTVPDQETWFRRVIQFAHTNGLQITVDELKEGIMAKMAQRLEDKSALEIIHSLGHHPDSSNSTPDVFAKFVL